MKFVIKYDILLPPPPNTIIFLPCQRQDSFLLGDYFDFYCYISEKYINITATWFFFPSVFGYFRSVFLGNRFMGICMKEVYWGVISGATHTRNFFFTFRYLTHLEFILAMGWGMGAISPFSNVYSVVPTLCPHGKMAPFMK